MPVEAVLADVQFSTLKPFDFWFIEIPIQDLVPFLPPKKFFCNFGPKAFRVFDTFAIFFLIILNGFYLFHGGSGV
jgi:hypothetical protein